MKIRISLFITAVISSLTIFAQAPRRVVVEEFTANWCGYCPIGKTSFETCLASYPSTIGMEVHYSGTGDKMLGTPFSHEVHDHLNPAEGIPRGAIDRFTFGGSSPNFLPSQFKTKVINRYNSTSPVKVDIVSTYAPATKLLNVKVTAAFVASISGDLRINCILAEDSVITPTEPQANYYSQTNGGTDPTNPWYSFPGHIPDYAHNGVVRANLATNTWGTSGVIPATVNAGSSYNQTYTFTIPSTWNAKKLHIIAFVSKYGSANTAKEIINANKVPIGNSTVTGIIENPKVDQIQVKQNSPNPFSEMTAIQFQLNITDDVSLKIYNGFGQLVNTIMDEKLVPGEHTFYWAGTGDDGKTVASGIYFYTISTSSQRITKPVVFIGW